MRMIYDRTFIIFAVFWGSFYRFVLEADVAFLGNNSLSPGPTARFTEIPETPLLTLNMITPESWMVEAVRSPYDLDNIHLQEVLVNVCMFLAKSVSFIKLSVQCDVADVCASCALR